MNEEQKIALINSQIFCAQAEIAGMNAANQEWISNGNPGVYYDEKAFSNIALNYGLEHNQVIQFLGG